MPQPGLLRCFQVSHAYRTVLHLVWECMLAAHHLLLLWHDMWHWGAAARQHACMDHQLWTLALWPASSSAI